MQLEFSAQERLTTMQPKVNKACKRSDRGIAILFAIFALLILTAITAALIMLSGTETTVNSNYRTEETAFFAAKTGIYEALDRMQQSNAASIAASIPTVTPSATGGVLYLINAGSSLTVQPWTAPTSTAPNPYFDTEFCHEGYSIAGMTSAQPDIPCSSVPSGSSWYTTVASNYPWSGTSAAMPYEWVRINWKVNKSQSYLSGTGTPTQAYYAVNSGQSSGTQVCWNGGSEVLLSTPTGVTPAYNNCEQYQTCGATAISPTLSTPVLMVTALAVTSNGSRQMVQAEAALNPPTVNVPICGTGTAYGFFAYGTGTTCATGPAVTIAGNASIDGYNSAIGPYATSHQANLGNVGTNQGIVEQGSSSTIGGTVYVTNAGGANPPVPGPCPDDFSVSGAHTTFGGLAQFNTPVPKPTINVPANSSTQDVSASGSGHAAPVTIAPNFYRNVSVSSGGTLILTAPGTFNFQCLTVGSNSAIVINPPTKAVTINITGNSGCASSPVSFSSSGAINNCAVNSSYACTAPGVASNLQINYNGTGTISLVGGAGSYATVNAPNSAVVFQGGSDYFGAIMANTIDDHGGVNLHYDAADNTYPTQTASTATATATGSYNILAFHALPY